MSGLCNLKNVVYQTTTFPEENVKNKKINIGILLVRWKLGYKNHIYSFSHERLKIKRLYPNIFGS